MAAALLRAFMLPERAEEALRPDFERADLALARLALPLVALVRLDRERAVRCEPLFLDAEPLLVLAREADFFAVGI